MEALPWLQKSILGVGSLLFIYIGIVLIGSEINLSDEKDVTLLFWKAICYVFIVTWSNRICGVAAAVESTSGKIYVGYVSIQCVL